MDNLAVTAVFFDIGNTLGSVRLSAPHLRLDRLNVYPYVPGVLEQLRGAGLRLGIISTKGDDTEENVRRVLQSAALVDFFEPELVIFGAKDSPEIFRRAAERAGLARERCLFVGEDRAERTVALQSEWRVAPHPRFAWEVAHGRPLRYLRFTIPSEQAGADWREVARDLPLVPIHVTSENGIRVYAIATRGAASRLDDLGFEVDRLGSEDDPLTTDMYLLRDDLQRRTGFLAPEGNSRRFFDGENESRYVLASTMSGLYVALPAGQSVEQYHFTQALHGHTLKLVPDLSLLQPFGVTRAAGWLAEPLAEPALRDDEVATLREISASQISAYVERYAGVRTIEDDTEVKVTSRHIQHAQNAIAVQALLRDLTRIGGGKFAVRAHRFTHEGHALDNVEAELAGEIPEMVLVTAHLDSTAAFSDGYVPQRDAAPGADDDGSGVAGVLAIAEVIKHLSANRRPRRTIRFVLFNAEEHGLVGSKAYARDEAAIEAPIVAVYQMDMIGFNRNPPRSFEVHAGFWPSVEIQKRSKVLAERVGRVATQVAPNLPAPQIYLSQGPEPQQRDPAEGRSDHASFHFVGYAACVASEDFFAGPTGDAPQAEPNPNYHQPSDTFVDPEFAADIARSIAAAAWITANA